MFCPDALRDVAATETSPEVTEQGESIQPGICRVGRHPGEVPTGTFENQ